MKYTIAEKELLTGMDQRNANAQASYSASVQNARNAQSGGASAAVTYSGGTLCDYAIDGYLIYEPGVSYEEAGRRKAFHEAYVLPQSAAISGMVRTGLTATGAPGDILQEVSILEYFERYRLYRHRCYASLYDTRVISDLAVIRKVTGWHEGPDSWILRKLGYGPYPLRKR